MSDNTGIAKIAMSMDFSILKNCAGVVEMNVTKKLAYKNLSRNELCDIINSCRIELLRRDKEGDIDVKRLDVKK